MNEPDARISRSATEPLQLVPVIVLIGVLLMGLISQAFDVAPGASPYRSGDTRFYYGLALLITLLIAGMTALLATRDRGETVTLITFATFGSLHAVIYHSGWVWVIALPILAAVSAAYAIGMATSSPPQVIKRLSPGWRATLIGAAASFAMYAFFLSVLRGSPSATLLGMAITAGVFYATLFRHQRDALLRFTHLAVGTVIVGQILWIQSYTSTSSAASALVASLATGGIAAVFESRASLAPGMRRKLEPAIVATALCFAILIIS